jgi:hypothetical protein
VRFALGPFAVAFVVASASGCYDFRALGSGNADLSAQQEIPPDPDGGTTCTTSTQCASAQNCVVGQCQTALASCAAQKAAFPQSTDGVYWIVPSSGPQLAYCDMKLGTELCTQSTATHTGRTREGSNLAYSMISVLTDNATACDVWAVRASDGFPLGPLDKDPANNILLTQCQTLGFIDDLALGNCRYGTDSANGYTNCGYTVSPLYAWGHICMACDLGNGTFNHYVKMGPFTDGKALTSVDGATRARCKTR